MITKLNWIFYLRFECSNNVALSLLLLVTLLYYLFYLDLIRWFV